jgi:hypothetical protein
VSVLTIHRLDQDNERPTQVEIKVLRSDGLEQSVLPARFSRLRCGQKARKTAAPAPRQAARVKA